MAKSSRRRKQDRARAGARQAEEARLKDRARRQRQREENIALLLDQATPPAAVAELVAAELSGSLFAARIARQRLRQAEIEDELDPGREPKAGEVAEAARLLLAATGEPRGLGVLAFAAVGAHAEGDEVAEHRYTTEILDRARAVSDDAWLSAVAGLTANGHPGEAFDMARDYLTEYPQHQRASEILGEAAEKAAARALAGGPDRAGPDRAGTDQAEADPAHPDWADADRAAWERFADRSGWTATRDAVEAFAGQGLWKERWALVADRHVAEAAGEDWPAEVRAAYAALVREVAVLSTEAGVEDDDDDASVAQITQESRSRPPRQTLLVAFAADPGTPPELADRALAWEEAARYGIWQVQDPVPSPGVWAVDLATGARRYAQFPPGALDGAPPWTAWLGCLLPVDGIWRASGPGLRLSPAEADAIAQFADQSTEAMALSLAGRDLPERAPIAFGRAEPYGVRCMLSQPASEEVAEFAATVTAALIPQAFVAVLRHRASLPQVRNTDGDPTLLITATPTVAGNEDGGLVERLLAHPDFSPGDDEPPGESPGGDEGTGGAAPAAEGWEHAWLEGPVPALGGLSPRAARDGDAQDVTRLESLLRQFEYHAGLATAAGRTGLDAGWLRAELDMNDPFEAIVAAIGG